MDLASLHDMLAPGAKLPANAKEVKQKTETAAMSASASFFIIHSSFNLVKHSVNKLSLKALRKATSSKLSNELSKHIIYKRNLSKGIS
jgi:hypothetical protein